MKIAEYIPSELLRPFIKTYRIIESQSALTNRVLPNTSLAIAFRFRGQVSYLSDNKQVPLPASTISGLRKSVRLIHYYENSANFIVLFKETGAKAFFEEPLHQLFEESISLDTFIKQDKIALIEEQLTEAKNDTERISIIEKFLLTQLSRHTPDRLISTAVERIQSTKGAIKIKELANTLYISHDAFEKRFRKAVGTSPKQFSTIIRMESIAKQKQPRENFTGIAFDAGYYDQSHFNKDFKLFTGQTPKDFFKNPSLW